jgi:hypothetical protein
MPRIPCCTTSRPANHDAHVSFLAGSASARPSRQQTRIDFPTRFCGPYLPMLFERIGGVSVPVKTTPLPIASGPLAMRGNRKRVRVAKPSSRSARGGLCKRGSVSARAGPVG